MAGPLDPIVDLVRTLKNAIVTHADHRQEERLAIMSAACLRLQTAIKTADGMLAPIPTALDGWQGDDAAVFHQKWREHLSPEFRAAAVTNLGDAAEVLNQTIEASKKTRKALSDLIDSLIASVAAGALVSLAAGGLVAYTSWAATTATRAATAASSILGRLFALRGLAATAIRGLATIGRSKLVRGLSMYAGGPQTAGRAALATLKQYGQIYRWSLAGNLLSGGVSRAVFGQNPLDFSIISLAQAANASTIAGLTGPLGQTSYFAGLNARNPLAHNVTMGVLAGGVPAFWNARIEGKSWARTFSDVALFSGVAGGFNAAVGRAFNPAPGQWGVPSPGWFKKLPPMAQSSLLSFAPSVGLRLVVPYAPSQPPPKLDKPPDLPGG